MKIWPTGLSLAVAFFLSQAVFGQGFVNLNFEQAIIKPDPSSPYYPYAVYASNAIPGWTATGGNLGPNEILYNDLSLGAPCISLSGTNPAPLNGAYSVGLYGGAFFPGNVGVSISQTGMVPVFAQSIQFDAQISSAPGSILLVSLGGQNIPFSAISTGSNYTVYGGDISAFAGQVEPLVFTAPQGNNNFSEIDDIQFSASPIPEPSVLSLFGLCTLLLFWRIKRPGLITGS